MTFLSHAALCCPLDQLALEQDGTTLRCENGHSFDIATQGYVNLLGAQDKRSQDPGDSKAMVAARREFLDDGHYQMIAQQLATIVGSQVSNNDVIADAGCGEGYYLQQLQALLPKQQCEALSFIGFDISKWAVRAATRRLSATWMVASNRNIPLAAGSVDCLLSLFGFPVYADFLRVLQAGGSLITVNAGPQHLIELREVIYPTVKRSASSAEQEAISAGFVMLASQTLTFQTSPLSQSALKQLLGMTPHLFRASAEGKARAEQLDQFPVTVDVVFHHLQAPLAD